MQTKINSFDFGCRQFIVFAQSNKTSSGPDHNTSSWRAANLLDCEVNDIQNNRTHAKKLQEKFGGIIVLKGKETLITDKDNMFRCMNGNPLLSSAGTGDVLTGFIGGLIAQGISAMEACKFAVAAHGYAVDQLKREGPLKNRGITSLI